MAHYLPSYLIWYLKGYKLLTKYRTVLSFITGQPVLMQAATTFRRKVNHGVMVSCHM